MLVDYTYLLCGGVSGLAVTDARLPDDRRVERSLCGSCRALALATPELPDLTLVDP